MWNRPAAGDGKAKFSRSKMVLAVANQDGGSHVDPELRDWYHELSRLDTQAAALGPIGPAPLVVPKNDPALVSVRQIAHEVERTLCAQVSELLGDEFQQRPKRVMAVGTPAEMMTRDAARRPLSSPHPVIAAWGKGDLPKVPWHQPCVCGRDATFGECCGLRGRQSWIFPD